MDKISRGLNGGWWPSNNGPDGWKQGKQTERRQHLTQPQVTSPT